MANTYTLIASLTVGSGGAANIEFTSIPATYTDLLPELGNNSIEVIAFVFCQRLENNPTNPAPLLSVPPNARIVLYLLVFV